jgi:protein-tyrosine phosphatase
MENVLMVCLGNICRSPLAEGILRKKFDLLGINGKVDSAGTGAYHVGERPDFRSQDIAGRHGIDISNQRARKFVRDDFDRFDAIYAMDRSNYSDIISLARSKKEMDKVHLILNTIYPGENRQIPDPYYGGKDGFLNVYNMLDAACDVIAKNILQKKTILRS